MLKKNGFLLAVILIGLAVILALIYFIFSDKNEAAEPESGFNKEVEPPEATGNIDDLVESLEKDILDEGELLKEMEADDDLITSDSGDIDSLGESVDDSELDEAEL